MGFFLGNNPTYLYTNLWSIHPNFPTYRDIHPSADPNQPKAAEDPSPSHRALVDLSNLLVDSPIHLDRKNRLPLAAILTKQNCFGGLNQPTHL